jgi:cytochrome c oxidase assembly protein subunit 15
MNGRDGVGASAPAGSRRAAAIAWWLIGIAVLVFGMVILGGATRLTHSGLSMVEWRPVTGWLPPLSEQEWAAALDAYRQYPQYRSMNLGMTVEEFRGIFWLEYLHRLGGRLVGIAFFVPLVFFLVKGWIGRGLGLKLVAIFVLGGLQGVLGWYMVKSGLVDRPDVSQYRLVAHLTAAVAIYGLLLWVAYGLLFDRRHAVPPDTGSWGWRAAGAVGVCAFVFITMMSGGFMAGTDAGFAYNTFPRMEGEFVPAEAFALQPWYRNFFEDVATIQLTHRALATITVVLSLVWAVALLPAARSTGVRAGAGAVIVCALSQYALGVATLLSIVPLALGVAHQAMAMLLWTAVLWTAFAARDDRSRQPDAHADAYHRGERALLAGRS